MMDTLGKLTAQEWGGLAAYGLIVGIFLVLVVGEIVIVLMKDREDGRAEAGGRGARFDEGSSKRNTGHPRSPMGSKAGPVLQAHGEPAAGAELNNPAAAADLNAMDDDESDHAGADDPRHAIPFAAARGTIPRGGFKIGALIDRKA